MPDRKDSQTLLIKGSFLHWRHVLEWVFRSMFELPDEIRPTHYGEGERPIRKKTNRINDRPAFEAFVGKSKSGFWLYGDGFSIDLQAKADPAGEIVFWASESDPRFLHEGETIISSFAQSNVAYAFGACWSEYVARNGYFFKYADRGSSEGFCGRDHTRYLPGLYWLNFCSNAYLERRLFDFSAAAHLLGRHLTELPNGKLLVLYSSPTEWPSHEGRVCSVIDQGAGIFSIRDVRIPVDLTIVESLKSGFSLSREWP